MKRRLLLGCILSFFCGHGFSQEHAVDKPCVGVLINGVCWAESNVDEPRTFAASPEAFGMFYQWNRKKGWPARGEVTGWDISLPPGERWETANDPCPAGWRVPTIEEIRTLLDDSKVTSGATSQNGISGRKYTDKSTGNTIFLPGAGWREGNGAIQHAFEVCYWLNSSRYPIIDALVGYNIGSILGNFGLPVRCVANSEVTDCDSIVKDTSETICEGDLPYTWGDTIFQAGTKTGKYRFQRTSTVTGCDSIVYLNLTVNPSYNTILYDTICQGGFYYKHGFSLREVQSSGSHSLSLLSQSGCDSIVSLHLHVMSCSCAGVLINGVCWAESNVDEPGTFAASPEAYGMFYQWNRKKGWPARGEVTGWDSSLPSGDHWEAVNDPCPAGWRVPTIKEIATLQDSTKVTQEKTLQNGVNGRKYTDKLTDNTIFLPAANWRNNTGFYTPNIDLCYWSSSASKQSFRVSALTEYGPGQALGSFGYSVRCIADGNVTSCDSIVKDTSETICEGDLPYTWGDTIFQVGTKTGKYRFQRTSTVTGCDSIVYLNLTVNPSYNTILYDTICEGASYHKHGFSLREVQVSGVHNLSLHSQAGCDSTVSLHLHVMSCSCAGVLINGVCWAESNVDEPGTFAASPEAYGMFYQWNRKKGWPARGEVTGWDSSLPSGDHWEAVNDPCPAGWRVPTIEEITTLQDSTKVTQEKILQNGVNGRKYTDKLTDNTIFLPAANWRDNTGFYSQNVDICYWSADSSNLPFLVSALIEYGTANTLGYFGYSVRCIADGNVTSCDSIVKDTTETICEGDLPYTWGDTIFQAGTKTGKYRFQRTSTVTGCDSIVYLSLTVNPEPHLSFTDAVCYGNEYNKNGFYLPAVFADTLVYDTLQSRWGCDSIRSLYLTVNPSYHTILYDTICQGDSYYQYGFSLANVQSGGSHTLTLLSRTGCDSTVSLHLTVLPAFHQTLYDSICPSERYVKYGFDLSDVTASGSFQLSLKTVHGCDSIVTLELYVYPTYLFTRSETICQGDTLDFRGRRLNESGVYYDSLTTAKGCDSIYCMNLTVNPIPHLSFTDVVCYGNEYNKNGFYLPVVFADTLIHDTLQSRWGCDSIRSLYLTVNPSYNTILYDTICQGDSYYQHGFSLANVQSGGSHTLTLLSRTGCDSTVSLHLAVYPVFHQTLYDSICPSERYVKYGFDLSDVTASGSFQLSLKTTYGCDSIVTLELYVYPTYLFTRSETICQGDTLDFRGRKLYESGVYYDSSTTAKGCDSIYCLNLTVNPAYDIQLSRILCEGSSYTEHGFNVSQAGVYHRYLKTNSGCDSIITLSLTEEKKLQGNIGFLLEDCSTHTYTFFFEPEILVISYQWDMGDGTVLRSEKGIHTYADSGVYRIQLRAATLNGCENMLSYIQHVPHYLPEVQLQADRQIIDKEFPTVHFCAEVLPEMTCEWDFGDGTTGEGICVSHTYHPNTEKDYDVTLTVTNTDGCITTSRAQIEVIAFTESVNTFSPNGDGINDVFMAGYRVEIVNRNGLRVYVGDNGWDGTYNGKQAPEDTYFYRLYYQTANGERMKTGYVTLIR